jgi:hypothetical protein
MNDSYWEDSIQSLPCGEMMLNKDIKSALDGGEIKYFDGIGSPRVTLPVVTKEEQEYYFSMFHFSEEFGLPSGRGWTGELPWVPHFLIRMRAVKRTIIADAERRATKRSTHSSVDPKTFEG